MGSRQNTEWATHWHCGLTRHKTGRISDVKKHNYTVSLVHSHLFLPVFCGQIIDNYTPFVHSTRHPCTYTRKTKATVWNEESTTMLAALWAVLRCSGAFNWIIHNNLHLINPLCEILMERQLYCIHGFRSHCLLQVNLDKWPGIMRIRSQTTNPGVWGSLYQMMHSRPLY